MSDSPHSAPAAEPPPTAARPTLGEIVRQYGPAYRARHAGQLSREQLRVLDQLARCRTGDLGHAVYRCDDCGAVHTVPQSCGNRHCPLCQGHKAKQWLQQQLDKLLPCAYFLVTFTLPGELRPLALAHPREYYEALSTAWRSAMVVWSTASRAPTAWDASRSLTARAAVAGRAP